ncbi:hypothetical protein GQ473_02665 [archaeon]|nr:hypothetical protein [archaeon]
MGLVITKFGAGTKFGVGTKFGYKYDDDTFDTDAQTDFETILTETGTEYTITQNVETVDGRGNITSITPSTFQAQGIIQDISKKDRQIHEMGLAVPGNSKAFFKPTYNDGADAVVVGDIITDAAGSKWKIIETIGERTISDSEVFRLFIIQNMYLEGSTLTNIDTTTSDQKTDIDNILLEVGDMYIVTQSTETKDGFGNILTITESTFRAYGLLQDISKKDRQIHEMGLAVPGNVKGYFNANYNNGANYLKEGDKLTDKNSVDWRIIKIIGERTYGDLEIFKSFILQKINLEGS